MSSSANRSPSRPIQRDRTAEGSSSQSRQRRTSIGHKSSSQSAGNNVTKNVSSRYQSSNLASTSSASSIRRQSLFGTDDRVVLDIGTRVTKIGFSSESRPRDIFWSLEEVNSSSSPDSTLWTPDFCRCKSEQHRNLLQVELKARLTILLRGIFHRRLLVDPTQRKVLIVENALMPTLVKRTMCEVLFDNLQVPSVCFAPSHLLSTLAIGRMTSIVLELGYHEATLLPIYHGRGLTFPHLSVSPRSGRRLANRLRALLLHFATFVPPLAAVSTPSSSVTGSQIKVPPGILTWSFLEEIKAKALLVGDCLEQNKEDTEGVSVPQSSSNSTEWMNAAPFAENDEAEDEILMKVLEAKYNGLSKVKDMVISVPPNPREPLTPAVQPSTLGAPTSSSSMGNGTLMIPGWIRERTAEVLFEDGDEDELSLVEMILRTLIKLPVDLRVILAGNIYVVGGTAMLPGLAHRIRKDVVRRLVEARSGSTDVASSIIALTFPRIGPAKAKTTPHSTNSPRPIDTIEENEEGNASLLSIGGQDNLERVAVSLESKTMKHQREQKESYRCRPISFLAPYVAILNDHAPRIDVNGQSIGGVAPSFPVNLSSWIGGSLLSSLRIDIVDDKSREKWDEEQEAIEAAQSKARKREQENRPGLGAGRGSFLGTVGGLDLGSYGPLSAGARGPFSGNSPRSPSVA